MEQTFKKSISYYNSLMSKADERTSSWPLMGSPFPILTIIVSYVYFVKILGPAWMKNRRPFPIGNVILAYNAALIFINAFFFVYGGSKTYLGKFNWICEPIDYSTSKEAMLLVRLGWWYLIVKIVELGDTILFVLTKKFSHISVLHVFHHSAVAWGVWIGVTFGAGGHNAFFPFVNCLVHTIMYVYYFLAAMGPSMKKYLWWKKYVTIVQMIQFFVVGGHAMIPVFTECNYHPGFAYGMAVHAVIFTVLFLDFYFKAYLKNKPEVNSGIVTAKASTDVAFQNGMAYTLTGHSMNLKEVKRE